ncbi:MAG: GDP-mannose 4,6-dehydratase [Alphaproteobacteria bacterium]|nr:GDP-mannose 4,6-dehydratase [Alphaproteobacteria bacterium]
MAEPILVTGAAGFIGFHTVLRLLQAGAHVVGVDNLNDYYDVSLKQARLRELDNFKDFTFIKEDIANFEGMEKLWKEHGPFKQVIHLAAQAGVRYSLKNPHTYVQSNLVGHLNILELCRHTEGFEHLVFASSSSVYGKNKKLPYAVEDRVDQPVSLYAATKRSGELMSHSYSHLYGIPQTSLRFFTVYGPWGRPDMSPYIFTDAIIKDKKVPIFNNGDMKRDFTYIDDIVSGVLAVLETPPKRENDEGIPYRILNIGNNKAENLMDYVGAIEKALGKKADIELLPMQAGDVKETYADIDETTKLTGYKPTTSIDEGIPKYVAWFKDFYGEE